MKFVSLFLLAKCNSTMWNVNIIARAIRSCQSKYPAIYIFHSQKVFNKKEPLKRLLINGLGLCLPRDRFRVAHSLGQLDGRFFHLLIDIVDFKVIK